jgi:hypothetical protein
VLFSVFDSRTSVNCATHSLLALSTCGDKDKDRVKATRCEPLGRNPELDQPSILLTAGDKSI